MNKNLLLIILIFNFTFCSFGKNLTVTSPENIKSLRAYVGGTGGTYTKKTFSSSINYQYTVGSGGSVDIGGYSRTPSDTIDNSGKKGEVKIACPSSAGILSGSQSICIFGTTSTTFSSTVAGGTWSTSNPSVASVNSATGVVTAISAGMATITYTITAPSCTTQTASRIIYVSNSVGAAPATLTGSSAQCQGNTAIFTASAVPGSYAYTWSYSGSGATLTPSADGLTVSIAFSATATSGSLKVTSTNACGTGNWGTSTYIDVDPSITEIPVVTGASDIQCNYVQLNWNKISNAVGYYLDIATDTAFTNFVSGYNSYDVPYNNGMSPVFNLPSGTLYYRVRAYTSCTTTVNSNTVSFMTRSPVGGSISSASAQSTICSDTSPSDLILTGSVGSILRWEKSTDAAFTAPITINVTTAVLSGATIGPLFANTYFRAVLKNSYCNSYSNSYLINVLAVPAIPAITTAAATCSADGSSTIANYTAGTVYGFTPAGPTVDNTGLISGMVIGTSYTVTASNTDCTSLASVAFEIKKRNVLEASISGPISPEYCAGDKDGSFKVEINGGTKPYKVSLDNVNGIYEQVTGSKHSFLDLSGGSHTVFVKDALGCTAQLNVEMPTPIMINPIATVNYNCENNTAVNSVSIAINSAITNPSDVDYALDGGTYQPENMFTNIAPGIHTITARHSEGCIESTASFTIKKIQPLTLTLTNGELNEIVATASGGQGDYQYSFEEEPFTTNNKHIIYKSGLYNVTVTDKYGCSATVSQYFNYVDVCIPNYFTPNRDGVNDEWGPDCTVNYKKLTFTVIDRYGRTIGNFRLGQKWDGKYNGAELASGDYWYVIKLNDPKDNREFLGSFTLYR